MVRTHFKCKAEKVKNVSRKNKANLKKKRERKRKTLNVGKIKVKIEPGYENQEVKIEPGIENAVKVKVKIEPGTESETLKPVAVKKTFEACGIKFSKIFVGIENPAEERPKKFKYSLDDLVFARIRGYKPWPARIMKQLKFGTFSYLNRYEVLFFQSNQLGYCSEKDIENFYEARDKYILIRDEKFRRAMNELEMFDELLGEKKNIFERLGIDQTKAEHLFQPVCEGKSRAAKGRIIYMGCVQLFHRGCTPQVKLQKLDAQE